MGTMHFNLLLIGTERSFILFLAPRRSTQKEQQTTSSENGSVFTDSRERSYQIVGPSSQASSSARFSRVSALKVQCPQPTTRRQMGSRNDGTRR